MKYRAILITGATFGGGAYQFGKWRKTFKQAAHDLNQMKIHECYSDSYFGIEVQKA